MPPVWFVVERHHGQETPALFYDFLPARFTRKLPVDDKKKAIEQPPTSFMLRLDRMPNDPDWRVRPLSELMGLYKRLKALGKLPPPNTADPPKEGGQKGIEMGPEFWRFAPARPWHGMPARPWPEPGTLQPRPQAGAYIHNETDLPGVD